MKSLKPNNSKNIRKDPATCKLALQQYLAIKEIQIEKDYYLWYFKSFLEFVPRKFRCDRRFGRVCPAFEFCAINGSVLFSKTPLVY